MRNATTLCALVLLGVLAATAGCRSKVVPEEPDDVNVVIDTAIAAGADIPTSKRGVVAHMLRLNEKDLILGLRTFADLSGGHYPSSLDARSTLKQVETGQLGSSLPESTKEQVLQDIFFASVFYEKLQREGRDAQYHGDTVGRQDGDKILMSWTESKDHCKALFGDLTLRTLSPQQLTELTSR